MSLNFSIIASGSSGNCSILWNEKTVILVDCGCSAKYLTEHLENLHIDIKSLYSLITHAHLDHISISCINFFKKNKIPIYVTKNILKDISKKHGHRFNGCQYILYDGVFTIDNIQVKSFDVHHKDNNITQTCGFVFLAKVNKRNYKIGYITDTGKICDNIIKMLANSNILVIESNYDKQMLKSSSRPYENKQWILSDFGHLSNNDTANAIYKISGCSTAEDSLKYVFLAHISRHHNNHKLAHRTINTILSNNNITKIKLLSAKRMSKSPTIHIN